MVSTTTSTDPHDWLTEEHKMLLRMRDTLYEGHWSDFVHDLQARAENRPHVFDIVPPSAEVRSTIEGHLRLIEEMRAWEATTNLRLHA